MHQTADRHGCDSLSLRCEAPSGDTRRCFPLRFRSHPCSGWQTFASKALTPTEQRYANIKRELLAIVFGVERFHTYVFGRTFSVFTDHKPLEQIQQKTLADAPARLQWMLLCLQGYDCTIIYRPGREMLLADTLSRYTPLNSSEIELDVTIRHVYIGNTCKALFQELTRTDPLLRSLAETIIDG